MRTLETFYKPGLESPQTIISELPESPRTVHAAGVVASKIIRAIVILCALGIGAYAEIRLWDNFALRASVLSWTVGIALLPIVLCFVPWLCITSYKRRMAAYMRYCRIYCGGSAAIGWVNTISRVTGSNLDCHYVEHSWTSSLSKVRIDYTFDVGGDVKTGTVIMHEQSAKYLVPNMEICVLYLPENVSENMIYPIPSGDWFIGRV